MSVSGFPSLSQPHLLPEQTKAELQQYETLSQSYLAVEHHDDGTHGDLTADSLEVGGNVSAEGDLTVDGNVTAQDTAIGTHPRAGSSVVGDDVPVVQIGTWAIEDSSGDLRVIHPSFLTGLVPESHVALQFRISGGNLQLRAAPLAGSADIRASTLTGAGVLSGLRLNGIVRPTQITSNQNNYNPAGFASCDYLYVTSDAARDITGFAAQADGFTFWFQNGGGFTITLKFNSGSSSVGNQIAAANGVDVPVRSNGSVLLRYDVAAGGGNGFWFVMGA